MSALDFDVSFAKHTASMQVGEQPLTHASHVRHARFHDDLDIGDPDGMPAFVTVSVDSAWPQVVLSFRHRASPGFRVGVLIVPETDLLLVGSDETLLAYDLNIPRRLWRDETFAGFWGWRRHGDVVLMSAELELAGYSLAGERLWSVPVEPPWTYVVDGDRLDLDVMGQKSVLSLCGRSRVTVASALPPGVLGVLSS